jgi:hypothetical protein
VQGRAKIEEKKQAEIVLINIKKNEALAKLDIQYKTADRAKKTFGFIGIFFLTLLVTVILLNDLAKLINLIYIFWNEKKRESQGDKSREDKDKDDKELQIEIDRMYSNDLEIKLERVHLKLVRAVAANNRKYN